MAYYINKILDISYEEAVGRVADELKKEGFGILTEIVVDETLKKKLNVDFRKYRILGACNPAFAYRALQIEDKIGLMLPCNVVVQVNLDGKTEVAAIDPAASLQVVKNEKLEEIGREVREKLRSVIENL